MKKNGFTLAEVLITLAIIGIVAAMTIPSIIQNTQKQEYVSAMKKTYSALSQATNMVINEMGGTPDTWEMVNGSNVDTDRIMSYYIPHMLNLRSCKASNSSCNYPDVVLNINGTESKFYTQYGGKLGNNTFRWTLADGTYLNFNETATPSEMMNYFGVNPGYNNGSAYGEFIIDVNGRKNPNQFGRDLFIFVLTNKGLVPAGRDNSSARCITSTTHGYGGMDCAAKVLSEGAMNY